MAVFCVFVSQAEAKKAFDIVHHVTYNAIDSAGFLWALDKNASFVWGPVGGGQSPPEVLKVYGKGWYKQRFRRAMRRWFLQPNDFHGFKTQVPCIFANQDTQKLLDGKCSSESLMLETALRDRDIISRMSLCLMQILP